MITRISLSIIGIMILFSCSSVFHSQIQGEYLSSKNNTQTSISFMEDGKFIFKQNNLGVTRTCTGMWKVLSEDRLALECNDQSKNANETLSSGYMEPLKEEVVLLSRRKIKMGNLIIVRNNQ